MLFKRNKHLYIKDHIYGEPEDQFTVFDCFNCINRTIDGVGKDWELYKPLTIAFLELFGWSHLPMTPSLKNPNSTREDQWNARSLGPDGKRVLSLSNYWRIRGDLLSLSLGWENPNILEGDTIINSVIRRQDKVKYPLLDDKHYRPLRAKLVQQDQANLQLAQEIDTVLLSIYGKPKTQHITVGQLLAHTPALRDHFFIPFDQM